MQQRRLVKVLSIGCLTGLAGLAAIRELIARCSDKLDRTAVNAECIPRAQALREFPRSGLDGRD